MFPSIVPQTEQPGTLCADWDGAVGGTARACGQGRRSQAVV
uniref:Uncharacterized protein n=1 Tax=Arundo donax TaxID=35708 RepID=A0A0A9EPC4_ARUDO